MLYSAFELLREGVMIIDNDYKIVFINKACEEILSIDRDKAMNQNIDEFFNNPPENVRTVQRALKEETDIQIDILPYIWGKYDKYLSQRARVLRKDGKVVGAMVEFWDITEQIKSDTQLTNMISSLAVNIIPIIEGIGFIAVQPLPEKYRDFSILSERALKQCVDMRIQKLVIDLTALPFIQDANEIGNFKNALYALNLLGIEVSLSGIKPKVAQDVVNSGYEFNEYKIYPSLSQAITAFGLTKT